MTVPREHLLDGKPIEVVGFRCFNCGPTSVISDDYAVLGPLDGGGVQPLSGICVGCRERVEFCTEVSRSCLRVPTGSWASAAGDPEGKQPKQQEGDGEPDVPE